MGRRAVLAVLHLSDLCWNYRKQSDDLERTWWEEHGQLAAAKGQALEGEERSSTWQASTWSIQKILELCECASH